jgi:hypothetical protein
VIVQQREVGNPGMLRSRRQSCGPGKISFLGWSAWFVSGSLRARTIWLSSDMSYAYPLGHPGLSGRTCSVPSGSDEPK